MENEINKTSDTSGNSNSCPRCCGQTDYNGSGDFSPERSYNKTVGIIVILLAAIILLMLLKAAMVRARDVAKTAQCQGRLTQIAVALRNYAETYGSFPPAYVADKEGNPLYSWRVLILPFLGYRDLYKKFNLNERWDSKTNKAVTDLAIDVFQCPAQINNNQPTTSYMMVVGKNTISSGTRGRHPDEITDGMANTIMVVEVAESQTWWAEPADLDFETMDFTINGGKRTCISSYHQGGANVVFCDNPVKFLPNSTNPGLVKAMITINGGEKTEPLP